MAQDAVDEETLGVVLVGSCYWPVGGGMEVYLRELAIALAGAGHRVRVATRFADQHPGDMAAMHAGYEPRRSFRDQSVEVEVIAPPPIARVLLRPVYRLHFRAPAVAARLMHAAHRRALRQVQAGADVVHYSGNGREMIGFAALAEARRARVPFVVTPHTHAGAWGDGPLDLSLYRQADAVVAVTDDERQRLHSAGVPAEALHIVPHGVSVRGGGDGRRFRARHGLATHPVVLFLGRKTPDKGYDLLLESAEAIWERVPEARLVLAGTDGPARTLPAALDDPRVLSLGRLDDDDREDAYAACDLFCLPSEAEAFGLVLLEAWSYGKPVVTSDIPTLRERLARGGGISAERRPEALARAIASLLLDGHLAERLGAEGQAIAGDSTWADTARKMETVYAAASARMNDA